MVYQYIKKKILYSWDIFRAKSRRKPVPLKFDNFPMQKMELLIKLIHSEISIIVIPDLGLVTANFDFNIEDVSVAPGIPNCTQSLNYNL